MRSESAPALLSFSTSAVLCELVEGDRRQEYVAMRLLESLLASHVKLKVFRNFT